MVDKFKVGQIVRTSESGGPEMCVVEFKAGKVQCRYWDDKKSVIANFAPTTIMHVSSLAGISDEIAKRAATLVKRAKPSPRRLAHRKLRLGDGGSDIVQIVPRDSSQKSRGGGQKETPTPRKGLPASL